MSTRCNIIVKDHLGQIILYHHQDGSPEHMIPLLEKYILSSRNTCEKYANALISDPDEEFEAAGFIHKDIAYLYEIDAEEQDVKCSEANFY